MLTIDDTNTILEKYGQRGFWYEIDFSEFWDGESNKKWTYDFGTIQTQWSNSIHAWVVKVSVTNSLSCKVAYVEDSQGNLQACSWSDAENYFAFYAYYQTPKMYIYLTTSEVTFPETYEIDTYMFIPVSSLIIPVINGEYDNKWYFKKLTLRPGTFLINGEPVTVHQDNKGTYLELNSPVESVIGFKQTQSGKTFAPYTVKFREFKTIPILSIPILYKGTPQTVQLYDNTNEREVTEFQAYYQGRKLKDNIIDLSYDCDDYIDIAVDLMDSNYPECIVKLKAQTRLCVVTSQAELETAITNGIQTIASDRLLNITDLKADNLTFYHALLRGNNTEWTNVQFIESWVSLYGGKSTFNNCMFDESSLSAEDPINVNDSRLTDSTITGEIHFTGTLQNSTAEDALIISDGNVNLINNTFTNDATGNSEKAYFPACLYLTGEYTIKGNTFILDWMGFEPQFNMCLIKTVKFNVNKFINENTLKMSISYDDDEPPNTLYYNLVDDDKIRAVRLQ